MEQLIKYFQDKSNYDIYEYNTPNGRTLIRIPFVLESSHIEYYQPDCHVFYTHTKLLKFPCPSEIERVKIILTFIQNNIELLANYPCIREIIRAYKLIPKSFYDS